MADQEDRTEAPQMLPVEITMEDVAVVRTLNPEFSSQLVVAATAPRR